MGVERFKIHTGDRCIGGIILKSASVMRDLPRYSASPLISPESPAVSSVVGFAVRPLWWAPWNFTLTTTCGGWLTTKQATQSSPGC